MPVAHAIGYTTAALTRQRLCGAKSVSFGLEDTWPKIDCRLIWRCEKKRTLALRLQFSLWAHMAKLGKVTESRLRPDCGPSGPIFDCRKRTSTYPRKKGNNVGRCRQSDFRDPGAVSRRWFSAARSVCFALEFRSFKAANRSPKSSQFEFSFVNNYVIVYDPGRMFRLLALAPWAVGLRFGWSHVYSQACSRGIKESDPATGTSA